MTDRDEATPAPLTPLHDTRVPEEARPEFPNPTSTLRPPHVQRQVDKRVDELAARNAAGCEDLFAADNGKKFYVAEHIEDITPLFEDADWGGRRVRRNTGYQPPFPWFGGKSPVADLVWTALGDCKNYVEPFFGSGAVLFLRPDGPGAIETVNDADGFVSNFWRAVHSDSDAVAEYADWPVNEADLHARHLWLLGQRERITERLMGDPEFYDAKAAGWWVWGQCCWIGSGWCSGRGPWTSVDGELVLRNTGRGVNRQLPHLGNTGQGVNRQLPHLGDTGRGVNRQLPHLGNTGQGQPETPRAGWLKQYLGEFCARLRHVRVCCGDWSRVCGPSVTYRHGMTGVFLDPPYADTADRTEGLYATDCQDVAHEVREWAIEQGQNPLMRIVLAGYEGEHEMPDDWRVEEWEAVGGYGLIADDEEATGRANKGRERLWLSPACCNRRRERQRELLMCGAGDENHDGVK